MYQFLPLDRKNKLPDDPMRLEQLVRFVGIFNRKRPGNVNLHRTSELERDLTGRRSADAGDAEVIESELAVERRILHLTSA